MKVTSVVVMGMLLAAAGPAAAKVNLAGALFATYWAQQEGSVQGEQAIGGAWTELGGVQAVAPTYGAGAQPAKKTFLIGNNMMGNGLQAKATNGNGFMLALDCPVNDWVKAYGELNAVNSGALQMQEAWIQMAFMPELAIKAGRTQVPFGVDRTLRPGIGVDEVFVSEYTQQARGALLGQYCVGVMALGTLAGGMVDYNLWLGNCVINTVADSAAMVAGSQATPDLDDAKQVGLNVSLKPFAGTYLGGAYFAGDYTNTNGGVSEGRARATAYNVNAGYTCGNVFLLSAEYATTRHDKLSNQFGLGVVPAGGALVANRVNEYIIKAIYTGVADWEFGARYSVVDPKNLEAEWQAQFSVERKTSFAVGYRFAGAAFLKAEYSRLITGVGYLNNISAGAVAAGATRQNVVQDVDDDIVALSLGLQF